MHRPHRALRLHAALHLAVAILVAGLAAAGCSREASQVRPTSDLRPFDSVAVTFAVLGDNRGAADGTLAPVFLELLDSIAAADPAFVVNTGDIVNGSRGVTEAQLRRMWNIYLARARRLAKPTYHAVGNHDVFDAMSARLWGELLGPTRFAIDTAAIRLIVLDSEADPGRIDDAQFAWLRGQLATLGGRTAFVVVHRPLFPVDAHIGTSLDRYFAERDRLHSLFVEYRASIGAVFMGHEHLFDDQTIQGVRYVITGGGGAPLYVPAELGGIYHYLLVTHDPVRDTTIIAIRPVSDPRQPVVPRATGSIERLADFATSHPLMVWDPSASISSAAQATDGRRGVRLEFDAARYRWPMLAVALDTTLDARLGDSIVVDVFAPEALVGRATALLSIATTEAERKSTPARLRPGWNRLALDVDAESRRLQHGATVAVVLELLETAGRSAVIVDNMRSVSRRTPSVIESFEHPVFWSTWNDHVLTERLWLKGDRVQASLRLTSTRASRRGAHALARLDPPRSVAVDDTLAFEVFTPRDLPATSMQIMVGSRAERHLVWTIPLSPGTNQARLPLALVPAAMRARIESIDFFAPQVLERQTLGIADVRILPGRAR